MTTRGQAGAESDPQVEGDVLTCAWVVLQSG
jgi:hypothetical protein